VTRLQKELAGVATMSSVQIRERWEMGGDDAAPSAPTGLLRSLLAQRLQEKRHGSLPLLVVRELERVAADTGSTAPPSPPLKVSLTAGTRLIREWNGQTIAVEVTDAGFVWNDRVWRSLTEIACEVTGAHWSGPRFFALKRRG
jgi:hypothetical protein